MTPRFIACLMTFLLIVLAWLSFAYLMRDTAFIADILGWGLFGTLAAGFLILGASE